MKNALFTGLLLVFASCQREDSDMQSNAKTKILGKWMLQKAIEEDYNPAGVLVNKEEWDGISSDSIIFRSNNLLYTYLEPDGDTIPYNLINDTTILGDDDEIIKIRKLTNTELYTYQEVILNDNTKKVFRDYFVK